MSKLERVTVNLIPKSVRDLDSLMKLLELSKTDIINRALQAYAYIERAQADGGQLIISGKNGSEVVKFL